MAKTQNKLITGFFNLVGVGNTYPYLLGMNLEKFQRAPWKNSSKIILFKGEKYKLILKSQS